MVDLRLMDIIQMLQLHTLPIMEVLQGKKSFRFFWAFTYSFCVELGRSRRFSAFLFERLSSSEIL